MRLDRALSKLGAASRTGARALVLDGRVAIDGRPAADPGTLVDPDRARITVDGRAVRRAAWRTLAFHKPRGVVTTRRDPEGRPTVFDRLGTEAGSLVAVGRLDLASTGLLLLTTDTRLADWLADPDRQIVRRYVVTARGSVEDDAARRMERGMGGLRAHAVRILKRSSRETHLEVQLTEGKNREIRRLLAAAGHDVTRLLRVAFGPLELGRLQPGEWRELSRAELRAAFPSSPSPK